MEYGYFKVWANFTSFSEIPELNDTELVKSSQWYDTVHTEIHTSSVTPSIHLLYDVHIDILIYINFQC